jgi:hypothetical protein
MKKIIFSVLTLVFISSAANLLYSQDDQMKKWMEYMTPGEQQKNMAKCTGEWKTHAKMWMSPGSEPVESDGTSTGEMVLGGRYLIMKHKSMMMGMPFEGISLDGYDNATKMYNSVWIDNMGTGIMYMTGKWNEDKKLIEYTGKMTDPINGGMSDVRSTVKMNDDGSSYMEMFGTEKGKEFKSMEMTVKK